MFGNSGIKKEKLRIQVLHISNRLCKTKLKDNITLSRALSEAPFTRDRVQMGSDPFGSDPLFEGRLHGIGSRTVGVYTGSDPIGFYELLAAL